MAIGTLGNILGAVILIAIISPYFLIAMGVVTLLYIQAAAFYRKSSREFKRIDAVLRSSLYSHFSVSLSGIATIGLTARVRDSRRTMSSEWISRTGHTT